MCQTAEVIFSPHYICFASIDELIDSNSIKLILKWATSILLNGKCYRIEWWNEPQGLEEWKNRVKTRKTGTVNEQMWKKWRSGDGKGIDEGEKSTRSGVRMDGGVLSKMNDYPNSRFCFKVYPFHSFNQWKIDWAINHKSHLNYLNMAIIYGPYTHTPIHANTLLDTRVLIDSANSTGVTQTLSIDWISPAHPCTR